MDDLTLPGETASRGGISEAEKARRRAAIAYARGSLRLEGFSLTPDIEALNQRYIEGEISGAEHSAAIRSRAGV